MERMVRPGEIYRHFKGELYQVVAVAAHSETGEDLVVYQALYGDFLVYARPFGMFVGEVDREKYPNARQRFRFELAAPGERRRWGKDTGGLQEEEEQPGDRGQEEEGQPGDRRQEEKGQAVDRWQEEKEQAVGRWQGEEGKGEGKGEEKEDDGSSGVNRVLVEFLDAGSVEERIGCLRRMKASVTQADLDSIYVVLDMQACPGSVKEQLDEVIRRLAMQQRYEGRRLR